LISLYRKKLTEQAEEFVFTVPRDKAPAVNHVEGAGSWSPRRRKNWQHSLNPPRSPSVSNSPDIGLSESSRTPLQLSLENSGNFDGILRFALNIDTGDYRVHLRYGDQSILHRDYGTYGCVTNIALLDKERPHGKHVARAAQKLAPASP
jgi:hypothetical protein